MEILETSNFEIDYLHVLKISIKIKLLSRKNMRKVSKNRDALRSIALFKTEIESELTKIVFVRYFLLKKTCSQTTMILLL